MARSGLKENGFKCAAGGCGGLKREAKAPVPQLAHRIYCLLGLLCCAALAQDPLFSMPTCGWSRILATVKDQKDAPVGSLEKSNFEIRDNGVLQQISVFERQTEQPLRSPFSSTTAGRPPSTSNTRPTR